MWATSHLVAICEFFMYLAPTVVLKCLSDRWQRCKITYHMGSHYSQGLQNILQFIKTSTCSLHGSLHQTNQCQRRVLPHRKHSANACKYFCRTRRHCQARPRDSHCHSSPPLSQLAKETSNGSLVKVNKPFSSSSSLLQPSSLDCSSSP